MKPILNEPSRIAMRQTIRTLTQKEQNPVTEERVRKKKLKPKQKIKEKITDKQITKDPDETPENMAIKMLPEKTDSGSSSKEKIISTDNLQKKPNVCEKINKPPKLSLIDRLFIRPISKIEIQQPNSSQVVIENIKQPDQIVKKEDILTTKLDESTDLLRTQLEKDTQVMMEEEEEEHAKLGESEIPISDEDDGEEKLKKIKIKRPEIQEAPNYDSNLPDIFSTSKQTNTGGTLTKRQAALEKWRQMGRRRNECERKHRERRIRKLNKY